MNKKLEHGEDAALAKFSANQFAVTCSWCGEVIRSDAPEKSERMCLICHARMLNDYFQRLHRASGGKTPTYRRRKESE
jgi:hypothetical protein